MRPAFRGVGAELARRWRATASAPWRKLRRDGYPSARPLTLREFFELWNYLAEVGATRADGEPLDIYDALEKVPARRDGDGITAQQFRDLARLLDWPAEEIVALMVDLLGDENERGAP